MKDKRREAGHSAGHRKRKQRGIRRSRPRPGQGLKHQRELEKRLRRTGQPIFGEEA